MRSFIACMSAVFLFYGNACAQAYWKSINENAYYSDPYEACKSSHESYSANDGIKPNSFSQSYDKTGYLKQVYCKWDNGGSGYWGTSGTSVLTCPSGSPPTDDANQCGNVSNPESVKTCHPINVLSGSKVWSETDFSVGRGRLKFVRMYSSNQFTVPSTLGRTWGSNLQPPVKGGYQSYYGHFAFAEPSGRVIRFMRASGAWKIAGIWNWYGGAWAEKEGRDRKDLLGYTLTEVSSTKLTLKSPDGVERDFEFSSAGSADPILTKIRYPDGYEIALTHNAARAVTNATDTDGYTISFTYDNRGLVESVTAPDSTVYKFAYKELPNSSWAVGVTGIIGNTWQHYATLSEVIYPDDTPASDADNPRKIYNYDDVSFPTALTSLEDERGIIVHSWTYAWHNPGPTTAGWRATSSTGPNGNEAVSVSQDIPNEKYTVTNALGKQTEYNFSYIGRMHRLDGVDGIASANCPASAQSISYDSGGRITSVTDPEGQTTTRIIDSTSGLPTSITRGAGTSASETTSITWDTTLRKPTLIQRPGLTSEFTYDTDWNLTQLELTDTTSHSTPYSTNGTSRIWTYGWSTGGLLQSIDGPLAGAGDTVSFTYDVYGNLASTSNELGQTTYINSVDGMGRPTQITEPSGLVTSITYTPRGWVSSTTRGGRTTNYTYDLAGNLTRIDLPSGGWFAYSYNDSSWLTQATTSAGDIMSYQHDLLGNVTRTDFESTGSGSLAYVSMQYDELGRLRSLLGGAGDQQQFGYDKDDRQTSITDGLGRSWLTAFNALNRVISQTDPENDSVQYDWTTIGALQTFTDGRGLSTTYVRNGFGDVIREISPDRGTTDFWYDAAGNLTRMLDADGNDVHYTYDSASRLLSETYPSQTGLNQVYSYDSTSGGNGGIGRLTSTTSGSGSYTFAYNTHGELTSNALTIGSHTHATGFTYSSSGELTRITLPSGREIDYTYDSLSRPTSIATRASYTASTDTLVSNIAWAPFGPITGYSLGNGTSVSMGLDASYRLQSLAVDDGASTVLSKAYQYDNNNRVTHITDAVDNLANASYSYHDDGRLHTAAGPWGTYEWTYDAVGNRLTFDRFIAGLQVAGETFLYGASDNRLTQIQNSAATPIRSLSYRPNGNTDTDAPSTGSSRSYTYAQDGRLSSVSLGGAVQASYDYDAFEQRVRRTEPGGAKTDFVFGPSGHLFGKYNGSTGAVITEYIWLNNRLIAEVDGAGVITYVQTGHLGQPLLMMDDAANVLWRGETSPFGTYVYTSGTASDPDLRFPGQWLEAGSGLYQNWHRDYDASLGRYIEADPIGIAAGQSLYGYVGQDPLNAVDPMGLHELTPNERATLTRRSQDLQQQIFEGAVGIMPQREDFITDDPSRPARGKGLAVPVWDKFNEVRRFKEWEARANAEISDIDAILSCKDPNHKLPWPSGLIIQAYPK